MSAVVFLGLMLGCSLDRVRLSSGEPVPVADAAMDAPSVARDAFVPSDVGVDPDVGIGPDVGPIESDAALGDSGTDAGPCPDGSTGSDPCPFTSLAQIAGVEDGDYAFEIGGVSFRARVDGEGGGGWMLVASADETTSGRRALTRTASGPVTRQSHSIFGPEIFAALDAREVRIDSSAGSPVVASVRSSDSYVLDQLRAYLTLHAVAPEAGSVRWRGDDADRMTSTCRNVAPESLDLLIYQTCGASGNNLHWGPNPAGLGDSPNRLNAWVYRSATRDRLNLWVRY